MEIQLKVSISPKWIFDMFWFYWFPIHGEIFILGRLKLLYDFRYIGSICTVTVLFHSNTMVARSANTLVVGCPSSPSAAPFHGTHPHPERCCGVDCDGCHEFYNRVKKPSQQQPATRPATRACGAPWLLSCEVVWSAKGVNTKLEGLYYESRKASPYLCESVQRKFSYP